MADRESDPNRQLDLLSAVGGGEPAPARVEKLAVRWVELDAAGRLGRAAWPGSGMGVAEDMKHLREQHRVSVILAVAGDPSSLLDAAAELGMDVRHLPPAERGERLEQQTAALAADLRAGRRAVVVSADASSAALPVAGALVRMGKSAQDAIAAVDGALEPAHAEVLRAMAAGDGAPALADSREPSARDDAGEAEAAGAHDDSAPADDGALEVDDRASTFDDDDDTLVRSLDEDEDSVGDEDVDIDRAAPGPSVRLRGNGEDHDDPRERDDAAAAHTAAAHAAAGAQDLDRVARSPRASRLAGAVLGGAIGDAMGHPTEFIRSFDAIRSRYGPEGVTGYELWRELGGRRVAPYTDDTQMAECVLRSLLWGRERGADLDATMRDMAERFVEWAKNPQGGHRAPGNACLAGCRNLERGVAWSEAGGATAGGCGSVMRAYPFGLVFAHDLGRAEAWAVAHSKLTHRDPIALAASAAMAIGVARVMRDDTLELVLSEMVAAACRYSPKTAAMMARAIDEAQEGVEPETTLERLEGWAAHEAIAAAVYLFARHPDDPRAAILEGANSPGDSDSLATLAGALAGARAGVAAIPADWVRDVERSSELLALALQV